MTSPTQFPHSYTGYDASDAWITDTVARLQQAGYVEQPAMGGFPARVLRRSDFRISWLLCKLHTFVILTKVQAADARTLEAFTEDAVAYAKTHKGGLPEGLQTGLAVFPVLVAAHADSGVRWAAVAKPQKRFAVMAVPMLAEPPSAQIATYSSRFVWGKIFQDFLGEQQRLIAGSLSGPTMPRSAFAYIFMAIHAVGLLMAVLLPLVILLA